MNKRKKTPGSREGSRVTGALETAIAGLQRQLAQIRADNLRILGQNAALHAQLRLVGSLAGIEPEMAEVERRVAARLTRKADLDNPASPVPDPAEEAAPESTEQALQPDAMDDVRRPGMTPGSVSNVPALLTTTPLKPGVEDQVPPATDLIDVTAPVQGTNPAQDGGVPLPERRIETDVRVGDPMSPEIAFPWNPQMGQDQQDAMTGPQDTGQQRAASREDEARTRVMASVRLARLRVQAGLAGGDEMALAGHIESDPRLPTALIEHEIRTLAQLGAAGQRRQASRSPARSAPSLAAAPRPAFAATAAASGEDLAGDADLFL